MINDYDKDREMELKSLLACSSSPHSSSEDISTSSATESSRLQSYASIIKKITPDLGETKSSHLTKIDERKGLAAFSSYHV